MTFGDEPVRDEDLHECLEAVLRLYPKLRAFIPAKWPRAPKYGVTISRLKEFATEKEAQRGRYWHILNLPLCVHCAGDGFPDVKTRTLMQSLLRILDGYVSRFGNLPGVTKTLKPLWTESAWTTDPPELWSVLATAFLAQSYSGNGEAILSFGSKIGRGNKDADIRFRRTDGAIVHVDVEAWHAVDFADLDVESARVALRRRVESKCGTKFTHLPKDEIGVAAIVCMAAGCNYDLMVKHSHLAGLVQLDGRFERQFGYVYWVGGISDGRSQWANFFDEKSLREFLAKNGEAGIRSAKAEAQRPERA